MSKNQDFNFTQRLWLQDRLPPYLNIWLFKTGHAKGRGNFFSYQKIPSGVTIRIITRGKWLVKTNGLSLRASRGDIFRAVPAETIEFSQLSEGPWEWHEIQFNGPAAEFFTSEFGLAKNKPVATLAHDRIAQAISLFRKIHDALASEKRSAPQVLSMLFQLIDVCGKSKHPDKEQKFSSRKKIIEEAVGYIENILFSNKNINQLSEELGVDRTTLYRAFKKEKGLSPHEFFDRFRMSKAVEFLGSEMPLSLIARRTGFSDLKYFISWFKSKKGIPPGAWRKKK